MTWIDEQRFSEKQDAVICFSRQDIQRWCGEETFELLKKVKDRMILWTLRKLIMDDIFILRSWDKHTKEEMEFAASRLKHNVLLASTSKLQEKLEDQRTFGEAEGNE